MSSRVWCKWMAIPGITVQISGMHSSRACLTIVALHLGIWGAYLSICRCVEAIIVQPLRCYLCDCSTTPFPSESILLQDPVPVTPSHSWKIKPMAAHLLHLDTVRCRLPHQLANRDVQAIAEDIACCCATGLKALWNSKEEQTSPGPAFRAVVSQETLKLTLCSYSFLSMPVT